MLRLPRASSLLAFGLSLFCTLGTASAVDFSSGSYTQVPGDFNADGLIDVLYQPLDTSTGGAIVLQDKTGHLSIVSQSWSAGYLGIDWTASDTKLTAADLNGDHFDDILVQPVEPGSPAAVLLMNGSSQLAQVSQAIPADYLGFDWSSTTHQVVVGDFDGDGRKELFMQAIAPGDPSYVVHADSTGRLVALSQPVAGQAAIVDGYLNRRWNAQDVTFYVGDFNGDGRQDLLMQVNPGAPHASESDYALLLADANGQFTSVAETWNMDAMGQDWNPATHKILIEDVNGDHIMDIVVQSTDPNGTSFLMEGNAQGTFTQAAAHWTGTKTPAQIAALLPAGSISTSTTAPASSKTMLAAPVQTRTMMANAMVTANAVGVLKGSGGVSGGTATYSIPIQVPPGIAGMQPSVSLNYSSKGGNGEMGMGWSLGVGSQIHRCPATPAMDGYTSGVTYTATDRLCLDGQHLILVSGTYGADQATYRTEMDGFSLVTEYGAMSSGTSYFYVYTKGNHVLRYGYGSNVGASPNTVTTPAGAVAPLAWAMGMDTDQSNNSIIYYYTTFGAGENLLTSIKYTGLGATAGNREVDFSYAARPDVTSQYLAGGTTAQTMLLQSISSSAAGAAGLTYNLSYSTGSGTGRSTLSGAQECSGTSCFPATTFNWHSPATAFAMPQVLAVGARPAPDGSNQVQVTSPGDLDGDGRKEVMYYWPGHSATIYFLNADGSVRTSADVSSILDNVVPYTEADLFGTGADALIGEMPGTNELAYSTYTGSDAQGNPQFSPVQGLGVPFTNAPGSNPGGIIAVKDMNGDGLADILYVEYNSTSTSATLYLQLNTTPPGSSTPQFGAPTAIGTVTSPGSPPSFAVTGDLDGNGLPDISITIGTPYGYLLASENSAGALTYTQYTLAQLGISAYAVAAGAWGFSQPMDINGDGLPDFVFGCPNPNSSGTYDFCYQINTGKPGTSMFGPVVDTQTASVLAYPPSTLPLHSPILRYQAGVFQADLDNDGVNELVYPYTMIDEYCITQQVKEEGTTVPAETCATQGDYNLILDAGSDYSIYGYNRIKFQPVADSSQPGGYRYVPVDSPSGVVAQSHLAVPMDFQGDGLTDVVSPFTTWYTTGHFNTVDPTYNYINGPSIVSSTSSSLSGTNAAPDLMLSATDGFGLTSTWTYYPLSSPVTFGDSVPFYQAPTIGGPNRYAGTGYFYFTSSMYAVGTYSLSNGTSNFSLDNFHYGQAIYNNQGHGFQGFRTVVDDDMLRGSRGVQIYHQRFPLSGLLQESWTTSQAASDAANFSLLNPVMDGGAIDHVLTQVGCNVGQGAEWLNTPANGIYNVDGVNCLAIMNAKTFFPFVSQSTETRYDLVTHNPLSTTTTQNCALTNLACTGDGYDAFGNLLGQVTTVVDSEGTYTSAVANTIDYTYAENSDWWLNKLSKKVVSDDAVYLGQSDPGARSRETDYGYDPSSRLVNSATSLVGATTAGGASLSATTTYVYSRNEIVSTTVSGGSGTTAVPARTTGTDYSVSGGYFPNKVTNPLGQATNIVTTDARFGEPSTITDANGVTTTYGYDAFGRKTSAQVTSPIQLPAQSIQYLSVSSTCPTGTAYQTVTSQAGAPSHVACFDMLDRALRSTTDGFGSGQTIYQDTQYDNLSRVTSVSEPYFVVGPGTIHLNTTSYMPDILGRVAQKVDAKGVVTSYNYNPADDSVQNGYLRPMTGISTTTPNDPLNTGYARVDEEIHNSLGKMMQVTNAVGDPGQAATSYAYDQDGNPVTITAADGSAITAVYDLAGHKTSVSDPDQGTTSYTYDALGELLTQTDAKAQTQTMTYDLLGRMRSKSSSVAGEGTSTWCYDVPANSDGTCPQNGLSATQANTAPYIGKQSAVLQTAPAFKETYTYDSLGRPTRVSDFVDGSSNSNDTDTSYNSLGQVDTVTYPAAVGETPPQITSLTSNEVATPNTSVTLTATANAGSGPQPTEYLWTQTAGPTVGLSSNTGLTTSFTTGAASGTVYSFRFQADDGLSAVTGNVTVTVLAVPAPTVPATSANGSYAVSWSQSAGADSYQVYQSVNSGAYTLVGTVNSSSTTPCAVSISSGTWSCTFSGEPNGTYAYELAACAGGLCTPISAPSAAVTVLLPPPPPAGLHITLTCVTSDGLSCNGANTLVWSSAATATSYRIYQSTGSGFTWIDSVGNVNSKTEQATSNGTYSYYVLGCNTSGCSGASNVVSVGVQFIPAPPNVSANPASLPRGGASTLTWAPGNVTPVSYFNVRNDATNALLYSGAGTSLVVRLGGVNTTTYDVQSCNTSGCSGYSSITIVVGCQTCSGINPLPTASNGAVTTTAGTAVSGTLSASGSGTLTFAIVAKPAHGTVVLTNATTGAFTYTPKKGYAGSDSFTFTASNSSGTSSAATESVTVNALAASVAPSAERWAEATIPALATDIQGSAHAARGLKPGLATTRQAQHRSPLLPLGEGTGMRAARVRPRYAKPLYQAWADAHVEAATTQTSLGRLSVRYLYTASGYMQQIVNVARPSDVYWTGGSLNARGQLTTETAGSGLNTTHTIDDASGFEQEISATTGSTSVQDLRLQWYQVGNLYSRAATVTAGGVTSNPSEVFSYDLHNRVTSSQVTNAQGTQAQVTYSYSLTGNINCESDVVGHGCTPSSTDYTYGQGAGPHALTSVAGTVNGVVNPTYAYDADGNMISRAGSGISWNSDNLPTLINQGSESDSFSYAPDKHRYKQVTAGASPGTTYYFGAQEQVTTAGSTQFRHWLTAYGKPVAQVSLYADSNGNPQETVDYVLTDHLGSVVGMVDASTLAQSSQSFTAFGQYRDPATWMSGSGSTLSSMTKHGFTGHERLNNVGLTHMNGRVMDPAVGRFLSVDAVYQAPTNSQSVNPYSYVMNNPLSLVDPSGYTAIVDDNGGSGPTPPAPSQPSSCSTGQTASSCAGSLANGQTVSIVDKDGNVVGTVGKDSSGNLLVTGGNGSNFNQTPQFTTTISGNTVNTTNGAITAQMTLSPAGNGGGSAADIMSPVHTSVTIVGTPQFVADVNAVKAKAQESGIGMKPGDGSIFDELGSGTANIVIEHGSFDRVDPDSKLANTLDVQWNEREGTSIRTRAVGPTDMSNYQSAALGLIHELGHAYQVSVEGIRQGALDENEVITGIEKRWADKYNEPIRHPEYAHGGDDRDVTNIFDHTYTPHPQ